MKTTALFTALLFVLIAGSGRAQLRPLFGDVTPVCSPEELKIFSFPNTTIESVATDPKENVVRVTAVVTHPPAHDRVTVWIALPVKNWNGRFRGNGGGGFSAGSPESLRGPAAQGFATAATDGGHAGGSGSFALNASGRLNWPEIRDFAYLGIHDMTVVGKAITQAFYGKAPRFAYFVGSSTGGRQGLMEAQRFPDDYDGIFAGCPAVNWAAMVPTGIWAELTMSRAKNFMSKAKLAAVTAACVAACDGDDGVIDGVIENPERCMWDPKNIVGQKIGGEFFSETDADVVRKMWEGPRGHDGAALWFGLSRGADLSALATTEGIPLAGKPFAPMHDWLKYFLAQNAQWDWTTLTEEELEVFVGESKELFGPTFSADDPDLARFRDHGGKTIIMHGLADQLIPHQGTVRYYERVQQKMGGAAKTAEFARLFLVPGVDHGFRGAGPSPVKQFDVLVAWVEDGRAPEKLLAEGRDKSGKVTRTRPIFPFPLVAKYSGHGSPDDAANFTAQAAAP